MSRAGSSLLAVLQVTVSVALRAMEVGRARRTKTIAACETCRKRKIKCDGTKPACKVCEDYDRRPCVYREVQNRKLVFKPVSFASSSPGKTPEQSASTSGLGDESEQSVSTQTKAFPPRPATLSIPFFRYFGPTGISPGYKRFFVPIEDGPEPSDERDPERAWRRQSFGSLNTKDQQQGSAGNCETTRQLFEADDNLTPSAEILFPLLEIFFEYYACHFPFQSEDSFIQSVKENKVSALLLNSMCAMAARFSTLPMFQVQPAYLRGEPFCNKAKHLLVPLLNMPSVEVVESILMIAWVELATCHDVGLWMYTGMAVRMAEDMGLHKKALSSHRHEERLLYWAIYLLDHIICFAVGRPLTIRPENVDITIPSERLIQTQPFELADPFPELIRVIRYQGLVNEEIRTLPSSPASIAPEARQRLLTYGNILIAQFTGMHPSMAFNIPNFRAHATKGQGGTYLLLHLWFNSAMISLHRPGLRFGQTKMLGLSSLCADSRQISLSLARTSSSILSIAELVDVKSILGSPFIDQAIEIASLVFIAELQIPPQLDYMQGEEIMVNRLREHDHERNYQICSRNIQLLMVYWRGIIWLWTVMDQEHRGIQYTDPGADAIDPYTSVWLSDRKMIKLLLENIKGYKQQDSAFGIAVTGTTNSAAKKTVTIIEDSYQQQLNATTLSDTLIWTSWLDNSELWGLDLD